MKLEPSPFPFPFQKRAYKATVLAGIFLGAAFVRVILFPFYPTYSWQYFLIYILPLSLIYLLSGVIVLTKWLKLVFLQKAVFIGIGVHYILNFFYTMANLFFFVERSLSTVELWLSYYPHIILNPFESLYYKFVIMPRTTYDVTVGASVKIYHWETDLLLPIIGTVYAGLVGFCIGKCILLYRNGCMKKMI